MATIISEKSTNTFQNAKKLIDYFASFVLVVVIVIAGFWVINFSTQDSLLLVTIKDVFNGLTISIINLASRC